MARRWNKTKKKTVLRIRLGRDQGRSRYLTAHSNRWKTGSDFAIGLISSPRWEQDTERKRRPSNDRVAGNKTEKKTVLSTPWEQDSGAALQRSKALPNQGSPALLMKSVRRRCGTCENSLEKQIDRVAQDAGSPKVRKNSNQRSVPVPRHLLGG
jgi:hypothetical protein